MKQSSAQPRRPDGDGIDFSLNLEAAARRLSYLVLGILIVGAIANVVIYHVAPDPDHKLARAAQRFDLGHEPSIPALYSSVALLASALLLLVISQAERRSETPYANHWLGLAVIFLGLAIDEAVMFHEMLVNTLREQFDTHGIFFFPWVIPGAIFTAFVGLMYLKFLRNIDRRTARLIVLSGAIFVGGAIGMELVAGVIIENHGVESLAHTASQTVEEGMEMYGVVLFLYALADYLRRTHNPLRMTLLAANTQASDATEAGTQVPTKSPHFARKRDVSENSSDSVTS